MPTARKPHSDFAGYVAELRNKFSGGHTVISDCKRAASEGTPLVEDMRKRFTIREAQGSRMTETDYERNLERFFEKGEGPKQ